MTSAPVRDPLADHLITPQNAALRVSLACELQRDWARQETASAIVEIVLTDRLLKESADVEAPV